jgi:hypothetical protein
MKNPILLVWWDVSCNELWGMYVGLVHGEAGCGTETHGLLNCRTAASPPVHRHAAGAQIREGPCHIEY